MNDLNSIFEKYIVLERER